MLRPDFAYTDTSRLAARDYKFLIDNFPEPGHSYAEIAELVHRLPTTFDSMLDSDFVSAKILDQRTLLLDVSPFLLFNVLLRQVMRQRRSAKERSVINYLANLLSIFVKTERLHRVQPHDERSYEYLVALIAEATSCDARRNFLVCTHIGNYALYLTGMLPQWIEYRHRYRKRTVSADFYIDAGRAYFQQAAVHPLAREYRLDEVFLHLARMFDFYRGKLNDIADHYRPGTIHS